MSDRDLIAEHLVLKGVTKCPTACLAKTTANNKLEERRLLRKHQEEQNKRAETRFKSTFYGKMIWYLLGVGFIPTLEYFPLYRVVAALHGLVKLI